MKTSTAIPRLALTVNHLSEMLPNAPKKTAPGHDASHAVRRGAVGFAGVSITGFAVWAFAGRWLHTHFGEAGLYVACAFVFIGLSGLALSPLIQPPRSLGRFYRIFVPAFIVYAIAWCAAWFAFGFGWGEWLGSIAGSAGFVAMVGRGLGSCRSFMRVTVVMVILHSAGYFLGGQLMRWLAGPKGGELLSGLSQARLSTVAKLSWGLCYGLGFGAGLGYAFHTFQRNSTNRERPAAGCQNQ